MGCEAVTRFASGELTAEGAVQLFWFDAAGEGRRAGADGAPSGVPHPSSFASPSAASSAASAR